MKVRELMAKLALVDDIDQEVKLIDVQGRSIPSIVKGEPDLDVQYDIDEVRDDFSDDDVVITFDSKS